MRTTAGRSRADNTKLARLSANDADGGNKNYSRISDINVQKGDYLCLRDVTLSYSFPKRWTARSGWATLTVSVSGNTLVYWTKVKGRVARVGGGLLGIEHGHVQRGEHQFGRL